jgi:hypothetical protein
VLILRQGNSRSLRASADSAVRDDNVRKTAEEPTQSKQQVPRREKRPRSLREAQGKQDDNVGLGGAIAGTACCAPTEAKPHTPRKKKRAGRMPALRTANGACLPVDAFRTKRRALQMKNARADSSRCSLRRAQGRQNDRLNARDVGLGGAMAGTACCAPTEAKAHTARKKTCVAARSVPFKR